MIQYIKERKFILKIFLILFVFLLIIIMIMNVLSFRFFNQSLLEEIDILTKVNLDDINLTFEQYLNQYQNTCQTIYNMPKIKSYILSEQKTILNQIEIGHLLQPFLTVHGNIDSIILFGADGVLMEKDARYQPLAFKEEAVLQIKKTSTDAYPIAVPIGSEGEHKILVFSTFRPHLGAAPADGVAFVINSVQLTNTLFSKDSERMESIQIANEQGKTFVEKSYSPLGSELLAALPSHLLTDEKDYEARIFEIGNNKVFVSQFHNQKERFVITSFSDYKATFSRIERVKATITILSISLIVLAFLLSLYLANRIYKPVNQILNDIWKRFGNHTDNTFSGSFLDASLSITSTAEKISQLELSRQKEEFLHFSANDSTTHDIPSQVKAFQQALGKNKSYHIVLGRNTEFRDVSEQDFIKTSVDYWVQTIYPTAHELGFLHESVFVLLLGGTSALSSEKIPVLLTLLQEKLPSLRLAITRSSTDISKIPKLLQEGTDLLKHLILRPDTFLFPYTITTKMPSSEDISRLSGQVIEIVKQNQVQAIPSFIKDTFSVLYHTPYDDAIIILANLMTDVENIINHLGFDSKEYQAFFVNNYLLFLNAVSNEELFTSVAILIKKTCLNFEIAKSQTIQINLLSAMDYIEKEYANYDLSVEIVAEKINISPSYFSKLFNNFTDNSFPEYLNNLRLEKAAALLIHEPQLQIKSVAQQVGFSSSSYFASTFRKKYGLSPSQYRNNHISN